MAEAPEMIQADQVLPSVETEVIQADQANALAEDSKGRDGEIIRDYQPKEGVQWRWGRPDYARVNEAYFQHRSLKPIAGSAEELVTKVVKNWEVDSHHLANAQDWVTMDVSKFRASVNSGLKATAQQFADLVPYNVLLQDSFGPPPAAGAPAVLSGNDAEGILWWACPPNAFPDGFAWECLEVYSGPPKISFKWRHFAKYTGTYIDQAGNKYQGDGSLFEVFGSCVATLNSEAKIEELEIFYNPDDMNARLGKAEFLIEPAPKPVASQECAVM